MSFLQVLALLLIVIGAIFNYGASAIVTRLKLDQRVVVDEATELSENELGQYRTTKAKAIVKAVGLAFILPGVLLVFYAFQ